MINSNTYWDFSTPSKSTNRIVLSNTTIPSDPTVNIDNDNTATIYRSGYNYVYLLALHNRYKNANGNYVNGYLFIRFDPSELNSNSEQNSWWTTNRG